MSQAVKEAIILTAEYYRVTLSPQVLTMYADDLKDIPEGLVCEAYRRYRMTPGNRLNPLPSQICEICYPNQFVTAETKAKEVAARIVGAIAKFGWNNARSAEEFIGPVGWGLIQRQGGWSYLCENAGVTLQPTTLQAQLRDQLVGIFEYGSSHMEQMIRVDGARDQKSLESIANVLKRITDNINKS